VTPGLSWICRITVTVVAGVLAEELLVGTDLARDADRATAPNELTGRVALDVGAAGMVGIKPRALSAQTTSPYHAHETLLNPAD